MSKESGGNYADREHVDRPKKGVENSFVFYIL